MTRKNPLILGGLCLILFSIILPNINVNLLQTTPNEVYAISGSPSDIQTAINQVALLGVGTVYLPEGDFIFEPTEDGAVKVPGGVNITGAGKDKTILRNVEPVPYYAWAWGWFFLVDGSGEAGASVHLSGFTIIGFRELYPNHDARTHAIQIRQVKDFVMSDIKIKDVGGTGIRICGWDSYGPIPTQGVIHHCDLINTNGEPMGPGAIASGPNVLGYGVLVQGFGSASDWIDDISQVLGHYDYGQPVVYIEDNYFHKWRHSIASNQVGHYVARYNTFEHCNGFGDMDAHGAGYGSGVGTRTVEVYNNVFLSPTPTGSWTMATVFHRGGGGVYFNNDVRSGWRFFVYFSNDGTWWDPISEVEKYFTDDVWIWNNDLAPDVTTTVKYDPDGRIVEGVNYHLNSPPFTYQPYSYPHPLVTGEQPSQPPSDPSVPSSDNQTTSGDEDSGGVPSQTDIQEALEEADLYIGEVQTICVIIGGVLIYWGYQEEKRKL